MRAPRLAAVLAAVLVDLSPLKLAVERVGTISYVRCRDKQAPGCAELEKLEVRTDLDWEKMAADAKKAKRPKGKKGPAVLARGRAVDQYGGIWIAALLPAGAGAVSDFSSPYAYAVIPDFSGYRTEDGQTEALKKDRWDEAVAAQPKPKKGLRKLLE